MDIHSVRSLLRTKSIYDIPLRVTYYARVSSESDEQLNSLGNQITYYEDLIKRNRNWTFVPGYIDEGLSGISTKKRENFNRMIEDAAEDKFDLLITKEISRFARNTLDSIQFTRQLLSHGVGVFFQNDNINTLDEDSELRLSIMSSIAQDELRKLSSRVKFGHQQAIKDKVVLGNSRIFGYRKDNGRLIMKSANVRVTTLNDYTYKVNKFIIEPLGHKYMVDVTADDVKVSILLASKKSESIYRSVQMLYKSIFASAEESNVIDKSPCEKLSAKGGTPQKKKEALTDSQAKRLLEAIKGLPPYVFVMIGLYAGLRREEILGLQWDCVYLDCPAPYLSVQRAWHIENNRPVILSELKTTAARRDIPLPPQLVECLLEAKASSKSEYVIANSEGKPLSGTQFKRVWKYIETRTVKERTYTRYSKGEKIVHTVTPVLGQKAAHNGKVVYSLDFPVTPHQLRHTYITNLIHKSVDPKTVQYLAGHENSKITMDIYAKVKYNKPEELADVVASAFS